MLNRRPCRAPHSGSDTGLGQQIDMGAERRHVERIANFSAYPRFDQFRRPAMVADDAWQTSSQRFEHCV